MASVNLVPSPQYPAATNILPATFLQLTSYNNAAALTPCGQGNQADAVSVPYVQTAYGAPGYVAGADYVATAGQGCPSYGPLNVVLITSGASFSIGQTLTPDSNANAQHLTGGTYPQSGIALDAATASGQTCRMWFLPPGSTYTA